MIRNIKFCLMFMTFFVPSVGMAVDQKSVQKEANIVQSFQYRYDYLRNTQDQKGLKVLKAEVETFLSESDSCSASWSDLNVRVLITAMWFLLAVDTIRMSQTPYITAPFATMNFLSLMRTAYKFYQAENTDIILARSILAGIEESLTL